MEKEMKRKEEEKEDCKLIAAEGRIKEGNEVLKE